MKPFYFNVEITKSSSAENGDFFVEGYAATTDLDRQGDVIAIEALQVAGPKMLELGQTVFFNHDYDRCIGRLDNVTVDEHGMLVKIFVSEWEQELRKKISEGIINKFSIGGKVLAGQKLSASEAVRRIPNLTVKPSAPITLIEKMELFEVSIVGLPANAKAEFVQKSFAEALRDAVDAENLGQIPDATTTEVLPKPVSTQKMEDIKTNEGECVMDEAKAEVVPATAPVVEVVVPVAEVVVPKEVTSAPAAQVEAPAEKSVGVEKQEAPAAPESTVMVDSKLVVESHEECTHTEDGKHEHVVEEKVASEVVVTAPDGSKSIRTEDSVSVRTYTEEEVAALKALHQKQLDDKDAMIQSLKAEVEATKALVAPVKKELPTEKPEVGVAEGKTTPIVVKDTVNVQTKELDADSKFLGIFKRFK